MALAKIKKVTGSGVHVPGDDVDTDQIIPARFLKCVTFEGLGGQAFYDLRFDEAGKSKNHPLDRPENAQASILISGSNFGCGSSREHAPQALYHGGIRAVIAESFAEIFFGNSTTLGMPCVRMPRDVLATFSKAVDAEAQKSASGKPRSQIEIDLERNVVRFEEKDYPIEITEGSRQALIAGRWDALGELLEGVPAAQALLAQLPYAQWSQR